MKKQNLIALLLPIVLLRCPLIHSKQKKDSDQSKPERTLDELNISMVDAAKGGDIDKVKELLKAGAKDVNGAMYGSAVEGHIEIFSLMIEEGANLFDVALEAAAYRGHKEIVKMMLDLKLNYSKAMLEAAYGGHKEIVELLIVNGAKDLSYYNEAIEVCKKKVGDSTTKIDNETNEGVKKALQEKVMVYNEIVSLLEDEIKKRDQEGQ